MFRVIAISCSITMLLTAVAVAEGLDDVRSASDSAKIVLQKAIDEKDSGMISSLVTEDAVIKSPDGNTVSGRMRIRFMAALMLRFMDDAKVTLSRTGLTYSDTLANETGNFRWQEAAEGHKVRVYQGTYEVTWKQEEGIWKIHEATGVAR